jgi:hypothetical protein
MCDYYDTDRTRTVDNKASVSVTSAVTRYRNWYLLLQNFVRGLPSLYRHHQLQGLSLLALSVLKYKAAFLSVFLDHAFLSVDITFA